MYRQVLEHITGVSIYPVISFVIFSLFFLGLIVYTFTRSKKYIDHMKDIPLEQENNNESLIS
jgi:cbb3-type cytochrome oxidase subunit 3